MTYWKSFVAKEMYFGKRIPFCEQMLKTIPLIPTFRENIKAYLTTCKYEHCY